MACSSKADSRLSSAALAGLSEFERAGLDLLKHYGQAVQTEVLATELLMLGMPFPERHHGADYRALHSLLHQGLVLPQQTHQRLSCWGRAADGRTSCRSRGVTTRPG